MEKEPETQINRTLFVGQALLNGRFQRHLKLSKWLIFSVKL